VRTSTNKAVTAVNADLAMANGWNGSGVGVAVIDSGVAGVNSDLASEGNTYPSRVVYNHSFVPGDSSTGDPYGHGTYVASLIAGSGYASQNNGTYPDFYRGVAPEAQIINLHVLDATGAGTDSSVIAAIRKRSVSKTTTTSRSSTCR
jgi:serine protease AprX